VPVTPTGNAVGVSNCAHPTAICVVRLEHQDDDRLLISLLLNLDIQDASGEWRQAFAGIDEAIAAVRRFAETFDARRSAAEDDQGP
jgi:hypothetical protein